MTLDSRFHGNDNTLDSGSEAGMTTRKGNDNALDTGLRRYDNAMGNVDAFDSSPGGVMQRRSTSLHF